MKQAANQNIAKKAALGTLVSLLVYVALAALLSLLVVRGTVGEGTIGVCVWVFAALAAFGGAKAASWRMAQPLAPAALTAAAFWILVLLLGFFANDRLDAARAAVLAIPVMLGGALAYLLRGGGKKRGGRKRRSRK